MKEENKIALNYCRMRMWERKRDCCARLWDCGLISGTRASVAAMRTRLRTHTQKLKTFISLFSRWWVSALFILSLSLALLSTLNTHKKFRLPCEGKVSVRWSPVLLLLFFFLPFFLPLWLKLLTSQVASFNVRGPLFPSISSSVYMSTCTHTCIYRKRRFLETFIQTLNHNTGKKSSATGRFVSVPTSRRKKTFETRVKKRKKK